MHTIRTRHSRHSAPRLRFGPRRLYAAFLLAFFALCLGACRPPVIYKSIRTHNAEVNPDHARSIEISRRVAEVDSVEIRNQLAETFPEITRERIDSIEFEPDTEFIMGRLSAVVRLRIEYTDQDFDPNPMMDECARLVREKLDSYKEEDQP
ncbi:MAG: hypothetical protein H7A21_16680 [Spirochaetales bacterium]|nr:hypothetical protein [Leptospiraceae bacterium]MCP5483074.1 hypothetical protein [Spirochaetales bacterium]MCP5486118.1 hypothetical protein [Spirochaetales bacterium]